MDLLFVNDELELATDDLGDDSSAPDGGRRKRKHSTLIEDEPKSRGRQGRVTEDKDFWGLFDAWMKGKLNDWGNDMNKEDWKG